MPSYENPEYPELRGSNDLVEVIEIGARIHPVGKVLNIKVLGALAIIDDQFLDWKIVAIDINDELAARLEDIHDVDEHFPDLLNKTIEWFRFHKVCLRFFCQIIKPGNTLFEKYYF
jgi:inorganic pyrophosphatase